jgi:hypothetical protein
MGAKEVFGWWFHGTPLYSALLIYLLFKWFDNNATAQANRAISAWLKGQPYARPDLRFAIISTFDRLYSFPLLRIRAFIRSAIISSVVLFLHNWVVIYLIVKYHISFPFWGGDDFSLYDLLVPDKSDVIFFVVIILADYVSLFVVRKYLNFAERNPFLTLFLSMIVGALVVTGTFVLLTGAMAFATIGMTVQAIQFTERIMSYSNILQTIILTMLPAFVVHLWLPLFALGAMGVRLLYLVFRTVGWAQWFFKGDNRHPLRAIGRVAAGLVFVGATIGEIVAAIPWHHQ